MLDMPLCTCVYLCVYMCVCVCVSVCVCVCTCVCTHVCCAYSMHCVLRRINNTLLCIPEQYVVLSLPDLIGILFQLPMTSHSLTFVYACVCGLPVFWSWDIASSHTVLLKGLLTLAGS